MRLTLQHETWCLRITYGYWPHPKCLLGLCGGQFCIHGPPCTEWSWGLSLSYIIGYCRITMGRSRSQWYVCVCLMKTWLSVPWGLRDMPTPKAHPESQENVLTKVNCTNVPRNGLLPCVWIFHLWCKVLIQNNVPCHIMKSLFIGFMTVKYPLMTGQDPLPPSVKLIENLCAETGRDLLGNGHSPLLQL